jgi:hypothetical protein
MTEEEEEAAFDKIIGILQKARGTPFDRDEALSLWARVLEVYRFHKRNLQILTGAEREQAKEIAEALGKARNLIEQALTAPNLANGLIGTWEMAEHYDVPVLYLRRKAGFQDMVDGMAALQDVASQVAVPRRRGRPKGTATATLPEPTIRQLSGVYETVSGRGAPKANFDKFVAAFTKCFVRRNFLDESIVRAIRRTKVLKEQKIMPWRAPPQRK